MLNHLQLIQQTLLEHKKPYYLEIGLASGGNFRSVKAHYKVGVDPASKPTQGKDHRIIALTSDEYFDSLQDTEQFHVIFIDGLHTFEQVLKDLKNALRHLAPDGTVIMHDTCPRNPSQAVKAVSPEHAMQVQKEQGLPVTSAWCGDVYKIKEHLKERSEGLYYMTYQEDYGLTVVKKNREDYILE